MKFSIFYIALICLLFSCKKEEQEKPKVIYESPVKSQNSPVKRDTTKISVADLPIHLAGTNVLIFPIGDVNYNTKSGFSKDKSVSYTVSNYGEYEITGFLENLKFQEIGKDSIHSLTDQPVIIQSATYLKRHADKTKQQIMVYVLEDLDTNKDARLDESDIKSLYLSDTKGNGFSKISPDLQELIDWSYVEATNSIYFRTIEDTNKDGEFGSQDVVFYYRVALLDKERKAVAYKI